jgi:TRAP-type C4-dicarboxylate transport system permease small subunit
MMLSWLRWGMDGIVHLAALTGAVGLLVALGAIAADVIGRAFGAPVYGARDVVSMAAIFVVFGGMALAHKKGAHVSVDLLERRFSPGFNWVLTITGHLLGAGVFALIARELWKAVELARLLRMSTNLLYLPRAPFLIAMAIMAAITCAFMLLRAVETAVHKPASRSPTHGDRT